MAKKLDPRLIEILKQYGEDANEALWDCHGTWVAYHKAIERIAAKAKIHFEKPDMIVNEPANKTVVVLVNGVMPLEGEADREEWSFGEVSPANNKNGYPYAMAEKRAKDRVVLKLVGLHGLVYSEEESDDFKPQKQPSVPLVDQVRSKTVETQYGEIDPSWRGEKRASAASVKKAGSFEEFKTELVDVQSIPELKKFAEEWKREALKAGWPDGILATAHELIAQQKEHIYANMSPENLADVPLKDALKQSLHMAG